MRPRIATTVHLLLVRNDFGVERSGCAAISGDDAEKAIGIDLVLELAQHAVERPHEPVRPIRMQLTRVEDGSRRIDGGNDEGVGQFLAAEQAIERRMRRHPGFDGHGVLPQLDIAWMDAWCRSRLSRTRSRQDGSEERINETSLHSWNAV